MCAEYLFVTCSPQEAERQEDEEEEEEGVSRVLVTSRRSPHKVERVSGLVTLSHVDVPKVIKTGFVRRSGYSSVWPENGVRDVFRMKIGT